MTVAESMKQILESDQNFGSLFYEVFFERCPEAKTPFDGVDMKRQALVITMALQMIEQYYNNGYSAIDHYLRHLGMRHKSWSISKDMYADWSESMLAALEKFHAADWSDDLRTEWQKAIEAASEVMFLGYDEHAGI
jgi:hemoglobin-like flavoprotein